MRGLVFALSIMACGPAAAMSLTSGDFVDGAMLPLVHNYPRCGGENLSPALSWKGIPANAKSLVLTMIDINVKPSLWSHWIVVDLPPTAGGIARGAKALPDGAHAVASNFGDAAYDGPCPPDGTGVHHYQFTIWALPGERMDVAPDASASVLQTGLSRIAIDRATITGWVKR